MTQEALAERAGLSVNAISSLERGARRSPHRGTVRLLCAALNLRAEDQAALLAAAARTRDEAPGTSDPAFAAPAMHGLPVSLSALIGRERELAAIGRLLAEGRRLVTLTGAGGTGKTRLAVEVARMVQGSFPDGVWYVDLAPLDNPALVPQVTAAVLGLRESAEQRYLQTIRDWLAERRALLILDNGEHLLEPCAALAAALLQGCPQVAIVATSRERLGIRGEQVFQVPPLPAPPSGFPTVGTNAGAALLEFAAVRLFVERAQAVRREFALGPDNAAAVVEICRRLDGLPLAIELAAARVQVLTPEEIARRLQQRFQLLAGAPREAPSRHRTLRALIDWSYELLSDTERAVLRRLSAFAGGWSLEAAETICGAPDLPAEAVLGALAALVDK